MTPPTDKHCSPCPLRIPTILSRYILDRQLVRRVFRLILPKWPKFKKSMILVIICLYSLLGNTALTGVSPYIVLWAGIFGISPTEASNLITYPNLAYGFGRLPCTPRHKFRAANGSTIRLLDPDSSLSQIRQATSDAGHDPRRMSSLVA